jgi:hypothetical protein
MNASTLPLPNEAAAPDLLRLAPSVGVLAGIVALFASVGSGLPSLKTEPEAAGLEQVAGAPPLPKPASDPTALAPISADEAELRNAALPVESGPNPAAAAFTLPADEVARMRSIDCLTAAIYYEAVNESTDGQRAVAQVVLNRVRHPHYPKTVCGVVFQGHQRTTGCQFSFTCDGSLRRTPVASLWDRARKVASGGVGGLLSTAGRLGHPLSRQLRVPLLGAEPRQGRPDRGTYLLSLGRRLGPAGGVRGTLCRRRARHHLARRLRPES